VRELPSGTVRFLFTDVEGSTALWEQHSEGMRLALARHDALIRAVIAEHGGHVVKTMGDAFHAAFGDAPAALATQRRLQAEPWGEVGALRVRMALHTGAAVWGAGRAMTIEQAIAATLDTAGQDAPAGAS
jgi:class 3 adenylate cyclase